MRKGVRDEWMNEWINNEWMCWDVVSVRMEQLPLLVTLYVARFDSIQSHYPSSYRTVILRLSCGSTDILPLLILSIYSSDDDKYTYGYFPYIETSLSRAVVIGFDQKKLRWSSIPYTGRRRCLGGGNTSNWLIATIVGGRERVHHCPTHTITMIR